MKNPKGLTDDKLRQLGEALEEHTWNNRSEIDASESCMCTSCYHRFTPSEIKKWQNESSAICPNPDCCVGGCVIGSASGLNFDDYDYSEFKVDNR
ncbi:hypothetical protein KCM76_24940 [Zooshikella marina]|uniref:hypothetical protein n=1 Tax=Zooshikella ganghwensis TaxID=202772 RepID=UPI001BB02C6A|nr:hypothetical protein [Zooshikella ganghwensis]MBU2709266.1 hypothetical protein [Zooshikella ganghwensis]